MKSMMGDVHDEGWLLVAQRCDGEDPSLLNMLKVIAAYSNHPFGAMVHDQVRMIQVAFRIKKWHANKKAATTLQAAWRKKKVMLKLSPLRSVFENMPMSKFALLEVAGEWKRRVNEATEEMARVAQYPAYGIIGKPLSLRVTSSMGEETSLIMHHDGSMGFVSCLDLCGASFKLIDVGGGTAALRNTHYNRYVRLTVFGRVDGRGSCQNDAILEGSWDRRFHIFALAEGKIALYSFCHSRFIGFKRCFTADGKASLSVIATCHLYEAALFDPVCLG